MTTSIDGQIHFISPSQYNPSLPELIPAEKFMSSRMTSACSAATTIAVAIQFDAATSIGLDRAPAGDWKRPVVSSTCKGAPGKARSRASSTNVTPSALDWKRWESSAVMVTA